MLLYKLYRKEKEKRKAQKAPKLGCSLSATVGIFNGGMREGLVFRSQDGSRSFKAVSNEFLLKYHA